MVMVVVVVVVMVVVVLVVVVGWYKQAGRLIVSHLALGSAQKSILDILYSLLIYAITAKNHNSVSVEN